MKKLLLTFLILPTVLMAQFNPSASFIEAKSREAFPLLFEPQPFSPPPAAAYVNPGSGWVPLTTGGSGTPLPTTPPPAALYVNPSGDGKTWLPWTGAGGSGGNGFPITLGVTPIASGSTTPAVTGLSVNGVTLNAAGNPFLFLNQAGGYTATIATGITGNVLNTDIGASNFIANGPSELTVIHGGYPEQLATLLGVPSANWTINALGSGSGPDWLSCITTCTSSLSAPYQNGAWPIAFPLGVTNLSKILLAGGFNDVSAWTGSPTAAQLDYFRGHWLAWSILYGIPDAQKIAANNTTYCATTGTWASAGAGFPSGSLSNTSGSGTLSCTFMYGSDAGMIFMKKVSDTATFTMTVNSVGIQDPSTASTTISTSAPYTGTLGGTSDLYAVGTGVSPNTPLTSTQMVTIVLTVTASSGGNPVTVIAPYALTPLSNVTNSPPVLIGLAPYQCNNGTVAGTCAALSNHSDAQINQARTQQINVVNELRGLLNVAVFDMNSAPNGHNPNIIADAGQVIQYTVTGGGSGFGTPTVTSSGGACSIQPTITGLNLPPVSGGTLTPGTYFTTTAGTCTSAPTITITGGTGATATASFDFDPVHPNTNAAILIAKVAQNLYNSAETMADKFTYPSASAFSPGGASGDIQYNNGGGFGGSLATLTAGGDLATPGKIVIGTLVNNPGLAGEFLVANDFSGGTGGFMGQQVASGVTNERIFDSVIATLSGHGHLLYRLASDNYATANTWLDVSRNGTTGVSATFSELVIAPSMQSQGFINASANQSIGTKFTTSGCSVSSTTGGATAGVMTLGANTCSVVVTMNGATGLTATNGWSCFANDRTSATISAIQQTASTTTTATFSIPVAAGATDVINFGCTAF